MTRPKATYLAREVWGGWGSKSGVNISWSVASPVLLMVTRDSYLGLDRAFVLEHGPEDLRTGRQDKPVNLELAIAADLKSQLGGSQ